MEFVSCDPSNYRAGRTQPVRYIVMHYTANNGDTARNNCDYYHRVGGLQASAHYFCDEHGAMQSVRECDTAWHCGARAYWHPECRNANSIGIEMCSRLQDGKYYFRQGTIENAEALARMLMEKYGIGADHVVRHYDVTHKTCPAPYVESAAAWNAFKTGLTGEMDDMTADEVKRLIEQSRTVYGTVDAVPDWGRATVEKLVRNGWLKGEGDGKGLNLSEDLLRTLVINDRAGIYGE